MTNFYLSAFLLCAAGLSSAQAATFNFEASFWGSEGLTYEGYREAGEDQVRPIEWVEYDGFRISFKVYPDDWTDPDDPEAERPTDPSYFVSEGNYTAQWRVYANNSFTVSAPEGVKMTSIVFNLMQDYFSYGEVTPEYGTLVCNGGETEENPTTTRTPAKPYVWTADNEEGYESVTFTVGANPFGGSKARQQFRFYSAEITYDGDDEPVIEPRPFSSYVIFAYPEPDTELDMATDEELAELGLSQPMFVLQGKDITVDTESGLSIALVFNNEKVAEIPANATALSNNGSYVEIYTAMLFEDGEADGEFGGFGEDDPVAGDDETAHNVVMVFADVDEGAEAIRQTGEYTLTIPTGFFLEQGQAVLETTYHYTLTDSNAAVEIFKAEKMVNVYSIDGKPIANGSPEMLRTIPAGIYVINGKTVIIRK